MALVIEKKLIEKFEHIVSASKNIVVVSHVNPDGDAIGSSLAMWGMLNNMGRKATVVLPNEFPEFLHWLYGIHNIIDYEKNSMLVNEVFRLADTLICLDFNDFERSEGLKELLAGFEGKRIFIDHHPCPVAQCDLLISYTDASSTCELLFKVAEQAGFIQYLDKNGADAIFTGMMTDTGNFSYNASDPETYQIMAKLLEKGIDKDQIHSNIYHTFSEDRWRLIGHALKEKMVILPQYRTGYISLSKQELDRFNFQSGDTEGLVNYPLMVKGVVFCVLFLERDNQIKLSFRSKGNFSTNEFSRNHFNGGGHLNASGGNSDLALDDAIIKFVGLLDQYREKLVNCF
jgi:bifunctional oligoribonuclease and PAP phosphatase NrnA